MRARMFFTTATAVSLLLGVATSQTQSFEATIPFDFQIGTHYMEAGRYSLAPSEGDLLNIRGLNTPDSAFVMTDGIGSKDPEQELPRLVFDRIGGQNYLAQVWSPDLEGGQKIELPKKAQTQASNYNNHVTEVPVQRR